MSLWLTIFHVPFSDSPCCGTAVIVIESDITTKIERLEYVYNTKALGCFLPCLENSPVNSNQDQHIVLKTFSESLILFRDSRYLSTWLQCLYSQVFLADDSGQNTCLWAGLHSVYQNSCYTQYLHCKLLVANFITFLCRLSGAFFIELLSKSKECFPMCSRHLSSMDFNPWVIILLFLSISTCSCGYSPWCDSTFSIMLFSTRISPLVFGHPHRKGIPTPASVQTNLARVLCFQQDNIT